MTVDLEAAIKQFLELAEELQVEPLLTAELVLQRLLSFYKETRVSGASLDYDGDMVLLQWGKTRAMIADTPIDLRDSSDFKITFEEKESQYLDFTRQIFAESEDEDAEFDDSAVQLGLTVIYQKANGDEPSSNLWIDTPEQINNEIKRYRENAYVQSLLDVKATKLISTVSYCG